MSRPNLCSLVAAAALALTPTMASAGYNHSSASSCQPAFGSTNIFHDDYGVANGSQVSSASFMCPINLGTISDYYYMNTSEFNLNYTDHSSTNNFSCYITHNDQYGNQNWSASLYTCSTAGGCADATQSFTGNNALQWTGSERGYIYSIATYNNASIRCDVPAATNGNNSGRSFIISYNAAN